MFRVLVDDAMLGMIAGGECRVVRVPLVLERLDQSGARRVERKRVLLLDQPIREVRGMRGAAHPAYFAYRLIKQQNTFAFYTSRAGLIEALEYKGNTYNATFPACDHPEHRVID